MQNHVIQDFGDLLQYIVNRNLPLFLLQLGGAKVAEEQTQRLLTSNKEKYDYVKTSTFIGLYLFLEKARHCRPLTWCTLASLMATKIVSKLVLDEMSEKGIGSIVISFLRHPGDGGGK